MSSSRHNQKISNQPSGGGNKLQGLAPTATKFFKANFTGTQYSTDSGDGKNRNVVFCMNQLGGIGRGRSQFGSNAGGLNCPVDTVDTVDTFDTVDIELPYRLDLTFGLSGEVITDISNGSQDSGYSVAIDSQDRILFGGYTNTNGNWDFALARYTTNGNKDENFGVSGEVITDISNLSEDDFGYSVAIDSKNRILFGGYTYANGSNDFALVRYTTDGQKDDTFGVSGKVITNISNGSDDYGYSIAIDSQDRILFGGYTYANNNTDIALVRYDIHGNKDNTFGMSGEVITDISNAEKEDMANSVVIDSQDRIILGGYTNANGTNDFALVRYTINGQKDNTFGVSGEFITDISNGSDDRGMSVAIDSQNRILFGGYIYANYNKDFALVRYTNLPE